MRGYQKKVLFMKNTGSDLFEEAYFILKEGRVASKEADIVEEARRIVKENEYSAHPPGAKEARCSYFLIFAAGFALCLAITLVAAIIFKAIN